MPKKGKRSQVAKKRCSIKVELSETHTESESQFENTLVIEQVELSETHTESESHFENPLVIEQSSTSTALNISGQVPISSIPASYHQGSNIFSVMSRGSQCTANALLFLAHYNENEGLRTAHLDNILVKGDKLYCDIITDLLIRRVFVQNVLSFEELPQCISTDAALYDVIKSETIYGLIKDENNSETHLPNLDHALHCFTTDVKAALLLCGGYCIAIFRSENGTFGTFDSHSRNSNGLTDPDGYAVMMNIPTFDLLVAQLSRLCNDLAMKEDTQYELMPVQFHRINANPTNVLTQSSIIHHPIVQQTDIHIAKLSKSQRRRAIRKIQNQQKKTGNGSKVCSENRDALARQRTKYRENKELRLKKLKRLREQYAADLKLRKTKKQVIIQRYKNDPEFRSRQKQSITKRYENDPEFRSRQKQSITKRYENDPEFRSRQKQSTTTRYENDPEFRSMKKKSITKRYENNPEFRSRQKQSITKRYENDPEFRSRQKQSITKRYKNDPEFRSRQKRQYSERYETDPKFKAAERKKYAEKYKGDTQFRATHKILSALRIKRKYNEDRIFRLKKKLQNQQYKQSSKKKRCKIDVAIQTFRKKIQQGPTYICTVCHRALFVNQVIHCNHKKYNTTIPTVKTCLTGSFVHKCNNCSQPCKDVLLARDKEYICHSCNQTLMRGKMPPIAVANKLQLTEIPIELQGLNVLERHVIAKFIPFAKIITLPKGFQKGVHGPVVCVAAETENTIHSLPRCTNDTQLLKVKLKRKLDYKGHYQFQTLCPLKVVNAVKKLTEIHTEYAAIHIDDSILEPKSVFSDVSEEVEPDIIDNNVDNLQMDVEDNDQENVEHADIAEADPDDTIHGIGLDTCLQPVDIGQEVLTYDDKVLCIAPAQGNKPSSLFIVPKIESMSFPVQFPDGNNTFDEPEREVKLSPSRYFNTRLFSVDNRFAHDTHYIFFAQFATEMHLANASISTQLRKSNPTRRDGMKINSSMLKNKAVVNQMVNNDEGTRFMQPLRGTPAYWEKTMRDLFAMLRQLGTPTFFCTFSAAEMRWPEIVTVIKAQRGEHCNLSDFSDLEWMEKCNILNSNPVTAMRMFDHRVNLLLKELILSPSNPIGEVQDYFYRVEFQQRGSPHIHCLFWVKDAPKFDKDADEKICEFVDQYISCELPDIETDPELFTIVTEVQSHSKSHSKSCKKGNKTCRFGFPKPPVEKTFVIRPAVIDIEADESDADEQAERVTVAKEKLQVVWNILIDKDAKFDNIDQLLQQANLTHDEYTEAMNTISTSSKIILKRKVGDVWVNGYNKHILRAWNANMDIQYILNPYICITYIVSYITKDEREMSEILKNVLKEAQETSTSNREEMKKVMYAYAQNREVSTQESVARTCSLKLKSLSRDVVFIPTDDNNTRMSLPLSALEFKDDDSEDIWMTSLPDRYKARPNTDEFHSMCMAEFASNYRIVYGKATVSKTAKRLQNDLGFIQKRTRSKPAIIRHVQFSQQKDPEKYCCTMLKLYLPYRTDSQLKTHKFCTYESFCNQASIKIPGSGKIERVMDIVMKNKSVYERHCDTINDALDDYARTGPIEDDWAALAPATEVERIESVMEREPVDPELLQEQDEIPELTATTTTQMAMPLTEVDQISETNMRKMYQSLNEKQASEFYFLRDWCKKCVAGEKPEPFFHFISGGAGTGKSHLIKCAYAEATKILQKMPEFQEESDIAKPTVLLSAFTGTAAFNIHGRTLHSIFKMPFRLTLPYIGLGNQLDSLRSQLGHVKILIIDEISMVSKKLFAYVHWRLQQIKGTKQPFGNVSVLAVGDFYQLPPLGKDKPLCIYEDTVVDFWKENFHLVMLTEIMRQKDDVEFANLLNRIRSKCKQDKLSEYDRNMLLSVTKEPSDCPSDLLHIYARNVDVDLQNITTVHDQFPSIMKLEANDYKKDNRTGQMAKQNSPFKGTKNDLPDMLQISIGARVVLTRNVDVADGLVNGSFGTIALITYKPLNTRNAHMIGIKFDHEDAGLKHRNKTLGIPDNVVCIERCEERMTRVNATRRQFPIKLAYACTIHKVQGMTTDSDVVSLKHIFEAGMAYVALSRTTSLNGLHITDFNENAIYCNSNITTAMEDIPVHDSRMIRPLLSLHTECVDQNHLTIVHHNTERLQCHIDDLKGHHELMSADIICLTETFLRSENIAANLQIPGYTLFRKNRNVCYTTQAGISTQEGGGVAMYIKNYIQARAINYMYNVTDLEFILVKIQEPHEAIVVSVYRPPRYSVSECIKNLRHLLEGINIMNIDTVIICGDLNEDQLSGSNKPILNLFDDHGFVQLIHDSTTANHTLLDVIYIKRENANRLKGAGVIQTYHSYHDAIFCMLNYVS